MGIFGRKKPEKTQREVDAILNLRRAVMPFQGVKGIIDVRIRVLREIISNTIREGKAPKNLVSELDELDALSEKLGLLCQHILPLIRSAFYPKEESNAIDLYNVIARNCNNLRKTVQDVRTKGSESRNHVENLTSMLEILESEKRAVGALLGLSRLWH